jgi:SAM-dependent methyltransferase
LTARPVEFELVARDCPLCGSGSRSVLVAEARIDAAKLDDFAFASRKRPEYMHHRLLRCQDCDLLYASPAPSASALHGAYEAAAYDSGEEAAYASATYGELLGELLPKLPERGGALDIGTGDGAFLSVLLGAGFRDVAGVEPSAAPVAAAAPEVADLITQGPFRREDFEAGRFRLVTSFQTLEHLSDPLAMCRDAYELLADGGAMYVISHNRIAVPNRVLGRRSPIFDVEHLQLFSPTSLRGLLERAGFRAVEVRPIVNRYPLRYWLKLLPVPSALRSAALAFMGRRLSSAAVPLPAGNMAAIGFKPAPASPLADGRP